jgi:hypothetical protein
MLLIVDWLCRISLGLLRLRLVMTLRLVFARFGTNRSNLLGVQVVHLSITCDRLPNVDAQAVHLQNFWFENERIPERRDIFSVNGLCEELLEQLIGWDCQKILKMFL